MVRRLLTWMLLSSSLLQHLGKKKSVVNTTRGLPCLLILEKNIPVYPSLSLSIYPFIYLDTVGKLLFSRRKNEEMFGLNKG